jgi:hypothetical protein
MVFGGCEGCSTGNGLVNRSKNENMGIIDLGITWLDGVKNPANLNLKLD